MTRCTLHRGVHTMKGRTCLHFQSHFEYGQTEYFLYLLELHQYKPTRQIQETTPTVTTESANMTLSAISTSFVPFISDQSCRNFEPVPGWSLEKQAESEWSPLASSSPRSQLRDPVTAERWNRMEVKIKTLYCTNGWQLRVIMDIMWAVYQIGVEYVPHIIFLPRINQNMTIENYPRNNQP